MIVINWASLDPLSSDQIHAINDAIIKALGGQPKSSPCEVNLKGMRTVRAYRGVERDCTGISAGWRPQCGTCTCVDREDLNDHGCPLHSHLSKHAEETN